MVRPFCIDNSLEIDSDTFDWVELVEIDKDHGMVQNQTSCLDVVAAAAGVVEVVVVGTRMEDRH